MIFLEQNIKGLCSKLGLDFLNLLADFDVDSVYELSITDVESIAEEYNLDLQSILFSPLFDFVNISDKIKSIKLLILDVDGVLTDGGMYYFESGDQMKKFNAKDGMGIMNLQEKGIKIGIISSGFFGEAIKKRAEILKIEHCYVGRNPKIEILEKWCKELNINLKEVAIIGDDVNDLEIMNKVGFSACPIDAIQELKLKVDLILSKKGGEGCVRELIDHYFLRLKM
jgi:3-deoxy-D-manno-octulosonate 8-phosphate phosphatase (KDO 8-P phosphatase)